MNKQLIEAMAPALVDADDIVNSNHYWLAARALKAINNAGFVVVPKEPTEAMDDAGDKHVYSEGGYSTDVIAVWKAMVHAAQESDDE